MAQLTGSDMAVLRRSVRHWTGTMVPKSIGARLRAAMQKFMILRDREGRVAGFGREGFTLCPHGAELFTWAEAAQRQEFINWR